MSVKVEGLGSVLKQLNSVCNEEKIESALGKACALVERSAKQKAPKGNGDLRRSISSKVEATKGTVYTPLEYAPYVEFGTGLFAESGGRTDVPWCYQDDEGKWHTTSGMPPHPYMRPALEENRKKIVEIVKEGITE